MLRFETADNWFRLVSRVNGVNQINILDVDLIASVPDVHLLTLLRWTSFCYCKNLNTDRGLSKLSNISLHLVYEWHNALLLLICF